MARTLPFHTVKEGTPHVFHSNDACNDAMRIEPAYWRAGAADRRLCDTCAVLNAAEERARQSEA